MVHRFHSRIRRHANHAINALTESKTEFQISPIKSCRDGILDAAIEDEEKESTHSITANPEECEIVCNPETFEPQVWL